MATKTPLTPEFDREKSPVDLSGSDQAALRMYLGIAPRDLGTTLDRLREQLSENQACLKEAEKLPTRASHIRAFKDVQEVAAKLYQTINTLPDHHRKMLPDVTLFVDQLAKFHNDVKIGLIQMRGRGSARGGGRLQAIARARQTAEHSIGFFFDMNARGPDGKLRSEGLTAPVFVQERKLFIEYCMDLIGPPPDD